MNNEYISVADFAQKANVSRQAIYKRLDGDLSTYCKVVNGKKLINIKALSLFEVNSVNRELTPFDVLAKELDFKNKEIERLQEENRKLSEQILALSDKVGNTLQAISQTQLADKMIEGKKLLEEQTAHPDPVEVADETEKKHWWQIFKKKG